jgi:apolipoprotein D and lipocalin family protein
MHKVSMLAGCILMLSAYYVNAQIPGFGACPAYDAMSMFNKTKFLGTWYEAERYFTVTELASKCIAVTYENRPDGKIWVNNAITNRL